MWRSNRLSVLRVGGLLLALLGGVGIVEACRREVVACCIQYCIQYVYVEKAGGTGAPPAVESQSNKIRALVIMDDNEKPSFNAAVTKDAGLVALLLMHLPLDMVGNVQYLAKNQVTRESILNAVRNMPLGPNDTLLVYYNGHGRQDKDREQDSQQGQYFDLNLNKGNVASQRLYREEVVEEMKRRNCLLQVLITDTCFVGEAEDGPSDPSKNRLFFRAAHETQADQTSPPIIQKLFLEHKGFVNINACKPKEYAVADIFTPILVEVAKNPGVNVETWQSFFDSVQKKTIDKAKEELEKNETLGPDGKRVTQQSPFSFTDLTTSVVALTPEELRQLLAPPGSNIKENSEDNEVKEVASLTPAPAVLRVQVPENAKLTIDHTPTYLTSAVRTFETPTLEPGRDFEYTLNVDLPIDGTVARVSRKVWVRAGQTTMVDLSDTERFRTMAAASRPTPAETPISTSSAEGLGR